jgi:hypothetical protein
MTFWDKLFVCANKLLCCSDNTVYDVAPSPAPSHMRGDTQVTIEEALNDLPELKASPEMEFTPSTVASRSQTLRKRNVNWTDLKTNENSSRER